MNILFSVYPRHATGDGVWLYRAEIPAAALRRRGHTVKIVRDEIPAGDLKNADLVVLVRWLPSQFTPENLRSVAGTKFVFDLDDNWWGIQNEPHYAGVKPTPGQMAEVERIMQHAHAVTTTTRTLELVLRTLCPRVEVLPNFLPLNRIPKRPFEKRGKIRIGFAGNPIHQGDLAILDAALDENYIRYRDKLEFYWFGCRPTRKYGNFFPMVDTNEYLERLAALDFDIGLAPMIDNPVNWCKSRNRFLEYTAVGTYTACSAVGDFMNIPDSCATKLPRENPPGAWKNYLNELLERDRDWFWKKSQDAYKWALATHDEAVIVPWWERVYQSILDEKSVNQEESPVT